MLLILLTISFNTGLIAFKISSELIIMEAGKPVFRFCPLTSVSKVSSLGCALPISIFKRSAVASPIKNLYRLLIYFTISWSIASPATFIVWLSTQPPRLKTAISVVPPPISITMCPLGSAMSISLPIAAANGSLIRKTFAAPILEAASLTALLSTSVVKAGIPIIKFGL